MLGWTLAAALLLAAEQENGTTTLVCHFEHPPGTDLRPLKWDQESRRYVRDDEAEPRSPNYSYVFVLDERRGVVTREDESGQVSSWRANFGSRKVTFGRMDEFSGRQEIDRVTLEFKSEAFVASRVTLRGICELSESPERAF